MPRYRKLHTKTVESLDVNDMPDDFTRLLWVLLPLGLCAEGRGVDNARWVQSKIFPLRLDVTIEMIGSAMAWYESRGMLVRYQVDGRGYFHIPTFHRYQGNTIKEAASEYPAPPGAALDPGENEPGDLDEPGAPSSRPTPDLLQTNSGTDAVFSIQYSDADSDSAPIGAPPTEPPAPKPAKPKPRRKPATPKEPPPPAVDVVREVTNLFPVKSLWPGIDGTVGRDPPSLDRWRKTCLAWVACGWNPRNVKGMLEHYVDKKIPSTGKGNGNGRQQTAGAATGARSTNPPATPETFYTTAELAALRAAGARNV